MRDATELLTMAGKSWFDESLKRRREYMNHIKYDYKFIFDEDFSDFFEEKLYDVGYEYHFDKYTLKVLENETEYTETEGVNYNTKIIQVSELISEESTIKRFIKIYTKFDSWECGAILEKISYVVPVEKTVIVYEEIG